MGFKAPSYFQLLNGYMISKSMNIYDRQSFARAYVLDNFYVCVFMYIVFYSVLWWANTVIDRIKNSNMNMLNAIKSNEKKLKDLRKLSNKRSEYEETIIKLKGEQKHIGQHLEQEITRLENNLSNTADKIIEMKKIMDKYGRVIEIESEIVPGEEECIFLVRGSGVGRRLYVFPEHRSDGLHVSLKAWEPDQQDAIIFEFMADDGLQSRYVLKIGVENNEKMILYYQPEDKGLEMVKKKTLPHLLYIGRWSDFVIRVPRGQILVYYGGAPNPIFEWNHPEPAKAFLPVYYSYTTEKGHAIGVAFDCTTKCQIEKTETNQPSTILSLSTWNQQALLNPDRLTLIIRGKGAVSIFLWLLPDTPGFHKLTMSESNRWKIELTKEYRIVHEERPIPLFTPYSWTNITVMWSDENIIQVFSNDTQVFYYNHSSPLLFYFYSLIVDKGSWATWAANCIPPDIDGSPLDGGWSEWGPWACSASCNGGTGTRRRVCNSPAPNIRGESCLGPSSMVGQCNTILCGDITEDTVNLIKRRLRRNHTSLLVKEFRPVTIRSDLDIVKSIEVESPDSEIRWSHNGMFVRQEENRVVLRNHNIFIEKALLVDSGAYTITVHRVDGSHMIFQIVTLAVIPIRESLITRETMSMPVTCNCVIFGYVFSDLKISWTINNKLWKDYGITPPITVNVDNVPTLNKSHQGLWKCIVEQVDLHFKWTTNAYLVKGAPNWRTHLMEDKLTRPIFGWMPNEGFVAVSALVIFIMLTVCTIVGVIYVIRFQESLKIKFKSIPKKAGLGIKRFSYKPLPTPQDNYVEDKSVIPDSLETVDTSDAEFINEAMNEPSKNIPIEIVKKFEEIAPKTNDEKIESSEQNHSGMPRLTTRGKKPDSSKRKY